MPFCMLLRESALLTNYYSDARDALLMRRIVAPAAEAAQPEAAWPCQPCAETVAETLRANPQAAQPLSAE